MSNLVRQLLFAAAGLFAAAAAVAGEISLFEYPDFGGRRITLRGAVSISMPTFPASSMVIRDGYWELCTDAYCRGRCATFGPGEYRGLAPQLTDTISSAREVGVPPPGPIIGGSGGSPRIELWERREYGGRSIVLTSGVPDFERIGFNDRADAAVVYGGVWRLCEHDGLGGQCRDFGPGRYNDLGYLGGKVSSAAIVGADGPWGVPGRPRQVPRGAVRIFGFRRPQLRHRGRCDVEHGPDRFQRSGIVDSHRRRILDVLHRRILPWDLPHLRSRRVRVAAMGYHRQDFVGPTHPRALPIQRSADLGLAPVDRAARRRHCGAAPDPPRLAHDRRGWPVRALVPAELLRCEVHAGPRVPHHPREPELRRGTGRKVLPGPRRHPGAGRHRRLLSSGGRDGSHRPRRRRDRARSCGCSSGSATRRRRKSQRTPGFP